MPRSSRIDAPGALHHIIARGIARRRIFNDDEDHNGFLKRLGSILRETQTGCYAWSLMPNHFHLLIAHWVNVGSNRDASTADWIRRYLQLPSPSLGTSAYSSPNSVVIGRLGSDINSSNRP